MNWFYRDPLINVLTVLILVLSAFAVGALVVAVIG